MTKSEITKFNSFLSVLDLQDSFRKLYDELHTHTCYRMSSGSKVLGAQGTPFYLNGVEIAGNHIR